MRSLMGNGDFLFYGRQAVFTHDTNDETLCAVFGFGELWDKCFLGGRECVYVDVCVEFRRTYKKVYAWKITKKSNIVIQKYFS